MPNFPKFKLPKLRLRHTVPPVLAFLLTATITYRVRINRPIALLTSTITAIMASVLTRNVEPKPPNLDWLDAIQAIAKIIDTFSKGLAGPTSNVFLDASLQRLLHADHSAQCKTIARRRQKTSRALLISARGYLDFALAPYGFLLLKVSGVIDPQYNFLLEGARGIDVAKYMLRLQEFDVIIHELDGERINFPRYFVAKHHPTSSIVISIRGTTSVSDVITDLLCGNSPFHFGYAHSGMLAAAQQILSDCLGAVQNAVKQTSYRVVVTGHSLGAGVGILLTKMLLLQNVKTDCFAFAPPPVFGPESAIDAAWRNAVQMFVNDDDLVSRLCFASAKTLALEMDALGAVGSGEVKRSLIDAGDVAKVRDAVKETPKMDCEKGFEALFHPAKVVHWLLPCDADVKGDFEELPPAYVPRRSYECFGVPTKLFGEIVVTPECVGTHMVNSYTGAFAGLGLPKRERLPPPLREDFGKAWYSSELG